MTKYNAGCSHILALSGQHLSILASLVLVCLTRPLGARRARIASPAFAILFVWVTGASPSLLRSLLMVLIDALLQATDREREGLATLSLCFIIALPLDPQAARSLSFTLSYLAIFGLVTMTGSFQYFFGKRLWPFMVTALAAGCAAQVATGPLLALSFGILQLAGLAASILAGPLVLGITWGALALAPVALFVPFVRPAAGFLLDLPYGALMFIMETASRFPAIQVGEGASALAASAIVVALGLLVYAHPHADARVRFALLPQKPSRSGGPGHVQAIRSELPRKPPPEGENSRSTRS